MERKRNLMLKRNGIKLAVLIYFLGETGIIGAELITL